MYSPSKGPEVAIISRLSELLLQIYKGVVKNCCIIDKPTQEREKVALIKGMSRSFDRLKHFIASQLVLRHPDFEKLIEVHMDASHRAIGVDLARRDIQQHLKTESSKMQRCGISLMRRR